MALIMTSVSLAAVQAQRDKESAAALPLPACAVSTDSGTLHSPFPKGAWLLSAVGMSVRPTLSLSVLLNV